MAFNVRYEECPICKEKARTTRKWVLNKYGKRYDYFIYHHEGFDHYSNQLAQEPRNIKKGELQKRLIETINSPEFKLGSFRVGDVRKLVAKDYPNVGFSSVKISLNRLAQVGIVERRKRGRSLHYVNTISKERLSFVINSITIELEDVDGDDMFTKHVVLYGARNDHSWPLYFIPFEAVGDIARSFGDLRLRASDASNVKEFQVILTEDSPLDKRVLLKLPTPLSPDESRYIRIEYYWPEPRKTYIFSAATKVDEFVFSASANTATRLGASLTLAARNETRDLSDNIKKHSAADWKSVCRLTLTDVEPFSVLQFKWENA